jgi:hypothetical protein
MLNIILIVNLNAAFTWPLEIYDRIKRDWNSHKAAITYKFFFWIRVRELQLNVRTGVSGLYLKTVFYLQNPGKSYCGMRLSTVDLLVLTRLDQLVFKLKILFSFFTKQAALMWRSTVLSLPPQLVFPAQGIWLLLKDCFNLLMLSSWIWAQNPGKSYCRIRLSTVDLLVLTSLDQLLFKLKICFALLVNKQP